MSYSMEILKEDCPNCPLCKSTGALIYRDLIDGLFGALGHWNISKCTNKACELLWLNPMPKSDEIWKAYQTYYTHIEGKSNTLFFLRPLEESYLSVHYGYKNQSGFIKKLLSYLIYLLPTEKAEIDFRLFYLNAKKGAELLDVGCGNGVIMSRLAEWGWKTTGVDFDEKAVEFCRSKGLNVFKGDLLSQNFSTNSFDAITFNHVVEHIFNPLEIFEECYRLLKPGGQMVIVTPNNDSWLYRRIFQQNWRGLEPPRHIMIFNRRNLSKTLKSIGFSLETSKTTIRNEYFMFASSMALKQRGKFNSQHEKLNKLHFIVGRFIQLMSWVFLFFNKEAGGEILIKAVKPK